MKKYQIGDILFSYESEDYEIVHSEWMQSFCVDSFDDTEYRDEITYEIIWKDLDILRSRKPLMKTSIYELYEWEDDMMLIYHWESCRFAFGYYLSDLEYKDKIPCYLNPKMKESYPLNSVKFLTSMGLHSKLLQKGAVVFHAAYIEWKGKAILFAGFSGAGKSTQADLWVKYADARIINGDRVLIKKKNNTWYAYGYPCSGSSNISLNNKLPIEAIVLLEQSQENHICTLQTKEKIRALFAGCEVHVWNQKEKLQALDSVEEIVSEIKIIKLKCRPDEEAVTVLENYLEE